MRLPAILEIKAFRDLWIGQTASQLGDSVYFLVFLFVADKVSEDPKVVGIVAVLMAIPFVIFGPLAGIAADRIDRRLLMIWSDFSSFLIVLVLGVYTIWFPLPSIPVLCVAAFFLSTVNTFFMPARSAAIPRLVPEDRLMEANGFAMASQQVVGMMGVAFSVSVLAPIDSNAPDHFFRMAVFFNGVTFLVSALLLRKLPAMKVEREVEDVSPWEVVKRDLRLGLKAVGKDPVLRAALPIQMTISLFISGFMVVYVSVNRLWYGGQFWTLAVIELSYFVMMMVFSLVLSRRTVKFPGKAFAWGIGLVGLCVAAMGFAKPFPLFVLANMACGVVLPWVFIPMNVYLQAAVEDDVRGKVNSAWSMVSMAAQPVGIAVVSIMLAFLGNEGTFIAMGVGMALPGFLGLLHRGLMTTEMPDGREVVLPIEQGNS